MAAPREQATCPNCGVKQTRAIDGRCVACGVPMDAPAPGSADAADPWKLKPAEEPKSAPNETRVSSDEPAPAAVVLALKQLGHDVTIMDFGAWSDKEKELATRYAKSGGKGGIEVLRKHEQLQFLAKSFRGQGEVPGAARPSRATGAVEITGQSGVQAVDLPLGRAELGGEIPFSVLAQKLSERGYEITLEQVAQLVPRERGLIANWLEGKSGFGIPACIEKYSHYARQQKKQLTPTLTPPMIVTATAQPIDGMTVSVCFGEEKFSPLPGSYSSCTIGPFFASGPVLQGETPAQASERLYGSLLEYARRMRDEKLKVFVEKLNALKNEIK